MNNLEVLIVLMISLVIITQSIIFFYIRTKIIDFNDMIYELQNSIQKNKEIISIVIENQNKYRSSYMKLLEHINSSTTTSNIKIRDIENKIDSVKQYCCANTERIQVLADILDQQTSKNIKDTDSYAKFVDSVEKNFSKLFDVQLIHNNVLMEETKILKEAVNDFNILSNYIKDKGVTGKEIIAIFRYMDSIDKKLANITSKIKSNKK